MYIKKTTGYVVSAHNSDACACEKLSAHQPYKVIKTGRVLTRQEERFGLFIKNTDIAAIANRGLNYYQVISNQGACNRCMEHSGAIYPVAEAKDGVNQPPFHLNCLCTIVGIGTDNPHDDPWLAETIFWLDIMYGDGTLEENAQKLIDFYSWTEFAPEFIARMLTATEDITNIGKKTEGFFRLLELASNPITITPEQLEAFGWRTATQEEADRLTAAFAECGITTRESAIQFMALAAAESGYGQEYLETGTDAYFEDRPYDKNERGAGYLQLTHREAHLRFLASVGDDFKGEDTAGYIAEHYPLESAIWFWVTQGYHDGGLNEFIETRLAKDDDILLSYLKTAYYVAGMPNGINQDINDAIAGKITYTLTEGELIIRGNHYPLPSRWKERLEAYEKAQEIW